MNKNTDLLLVSGSPRRRELLEMIGVRFEVFNADIAEVRAPGEAIEDFVSRLALEKAHAGRGDDPRPRLGADTIVVVGEQILGKPTSRDHAAHMLGMLSGRDHVVYTAVAVLTHEGQAHQCLNRNVVTLGDIPTDWILRYCQGEEPMDKAGAYAVQGLAGQWVKHIEGSYSGVMGLPLYETAELLRRVGIEASAGGP